MKAAVMTSIKGFGFLLQKAGPYLLLEILLPGGTIFALLLLLYRRRASLEAAGAPRAGIVVHVVRRFRETLDFALPSGMASAWRGRDRERDGLEALAIAPTM